MTYRVKRKRITRVKGLGKYDHYEPGDEIEPTDAELENFGDNLEKIESSSESVESDSDPEQSDESESAEESTQEQSEESESESGDDPYDDLPSLSEMTVDEVEQRLEDGDFSESELGLLHDLEQLGEDRVTVHRAIDDYSG